VQVSCTGDERISKARCKSRNGAGQLTVSLAGGSPGDTFVVELSSGPRLEGTVNSSGKGKVKFKNLDSGPGDATTTWGCGAVAGAEYQCP